MIDSKFKAQQQESPHQIKVQKLQELLEKCKERISTHKEQIQTLTDENALLKIQVRQAETNSSEESTAMEKLTAEWKGRVDRVEEEWSNRLQKAEERATLAIAQSKADTHTQLNQKDQEMEQWIHKCHQLEQQGEEIINPLLYIAFYTYEKPFEKISKVFRNFSGFSETF